MSMPTGKQNSYANDTMPDAVYVAIRRDQPVNLVNAFEKPIKKSENGYIEPSKKRFVEFAAETYSKFVPAPDRVFSCGLDLNSDMPLWEIYKAVEQAVAERVQ